MVSIKELLLEPLTNQEEEAIVAMRKLIDECDDELVILERKKMDDFALIGLIRCKKFDVEGAFEKLRAAIHIRRIKYPEIFADIRPRKLHLGFDIGLRGAGGVFRHRDHKGRQIGFLRASFWDPDELSVEEAVAAGCLVALECLHLKETQLKGGICIIDLQGFNFKQARQANPVLMHKYSNIYKEAVPVKVKGIHVVNVPAFFYMTFAIIKPFLPEKIAKRTFFHGSSLESLHKSISPDILPQWLGGKLTDEEAVDNSIIENLYTEERDEYYTNYLS